MMPLSPEYYFCTSRLSRLVQHWEFARLPDPRAAYPPSLSQSFASLTLMLPQTGSVKQGGKKLETIHMAREQRGDNSQTIAYHAEHFVLFSAPFCCLPVREVRSSPSEQEDLFGGHCQSPIWTALRPGPARLRIKK